MTKSLIEQSNATFIKHKTWKNARPNGGGQYRVYNHKGKVWIATSEDKVLTETSIMTLKGISGEEDQAFAGELSFSNYSF